MRLALYVGIYVLVAFYLDPQSFGVLGQVYAEKFVIAIPILLVGGVGTGALIFGRQAPTRYAVQLLRTRWRGCVPVILFFLVGMTAFSTHKSMIPRIVPFYADPWLADLDEWIHGAAPWELAHRLDHDLWAFSVFKSYEVLWYAQWFGTILFVGMWSDRIARIRYLWAAALTISIVGTLLALLLSSAGPIYYDYFVGGDRFDDLKGAMSALESSSVVREYADYLLTLHTTGNAGFGGGISAMPSLHVGLATLNAYFLSSLNRWLGVLGWIFAALIMYGSVYTGWHYAVDGYLSIVVVSLIWWGTGRLVREQGHWAPHRRNTAELEPSLPCALEE
ncbi:phosphatase PAP2 family protein [Mesorhizobium sp. ES1-4]|uniref:phosphatase PAP2 family protein n=1 Tax=Mesorhizobium sp. ES1-4 TaxID=2876627 RepID=UPI001CCFF496|nr:phosphatase PAP2 family protein [Mesorhizobium sp. ES1-4]MBZ9795472.1 phosphatase PAP2 family protein [Mesorhizobium sp. ES1-4]